MKRIGVVAILALAFLGIADSAYLAQHEISNTPLICNIQNFSGCNTVAQSPYSSIFGIPVAVYGVLFYGILFALSALELVLFDQIMRRFIQWFTVAGVLASLYFLFVQAFLIGAFCIYCIASAVIALLILIFASFIEPIRKTKQNLTQAPPTNDKHLPMPPLA